jgi:uncharacterized LabA/DUF88 family protein
LLPKAQIDRIRYFTARVRPQAGDSGALHQNVYLRALQTIPNLEIFEGQYRSHAVTMPLAYPSGGQKFARVIKTEEKGSDVNLAVYLVSDGYRGLYDQAAVISNDSDLVVAIRMVVQDLKKPVVFIPPASNKGRRISKELRREATNIKEIRAGALRNSLFPQSLSDKHGTIRKPAHW